MNAWTEEESADLDRAIKAARSTEKFRKVPKPSAPSRGQASQPRQLANGRWGAARYINKRRHFARFDTRAEAQAWLDQLKEGDG